MRLFEKKTIYGCEARGDAADAYLTRYCLIAGRFGQIALHVFHRSDADEMHDHPWAFASLILWGGYNEVTPAPKYDDDICGGLRIQYRLIETERIRPGRILFRKAEHRHRVELIDGKKAVTLVFMGPYVREWGFFTPQGWKRWKEYFRDKGC